MSDPHSGARGSGAAWRRRSSRRAATRGTSACASTRCRRWPPPARYTGRSASSRSRPTARTRSTERATWNYAFAERTPLTERSLVPSGRARRREAASSVSPVSSGYERDAASLPRTTHRTPTTKRHSVRGSASRTGSGRDRADRGERDEHGDDRDRDPNHPLPRPAARGRTELTRSGGDEPEDEDVPAGDAFAAGPDGRNQYERKQDRAGADRGIGLRPHAFIVPCRTGSLPEGLAASTMKEPCKARFFLLAWRNEGGQKGL